MKQKELLTLLVSDGGDPFDDLRTLLQTQEIETWSARSCDEVSRLLERTQPQLIFTGERLSDGSWIDVLGLAERANVPTNVIVVGRSVDIGLYLSTMDHGAFDFILPPFETEAVAHVVRVAAEDTRRRREEQAIKAVA